MGTSMFLTSVNLDYRRLNKKKARIKKAAVKAGNDTVNDLVKLGVHKAKSIAPQFTGRTARLIKGVYTKGQGNQTQGRVITPNRIQNRNFNLPYWMHTSPRAQGHIKSGNRQYMYETTRYLNQIKTRIAKGHGNRINIQ